jgi:hypothetical protein
MVNQPMELILLPDRFAICRLAPGTAIPPWATASNIFSITRTSDELSIVCLQSLVPDEVRSEADWRCFRVAGMMDFTQVGILASLVGPLADAGISVFAISTFDTDYLLVKQATLESATAVLRRGRHTVQ